MKERLVVNCVCLCRLSSYGFYRLSKGSNTDERSTSLVVIMSKIPYVVIKLVVLLKDVCGILA